MGYRSDVGLALSKAGAIRLQEKLYALDKNSESYIQTTHLLEYAISIRSMTNLDLNFFSGTTLNGTTTIPMSALSRT